MDVDSDISGNHESGTWEDSADDQVLGKIEFVAWVAIMRKSEKVSGFLSFSEKVRFLIWLGKGGGGSWDGWRCSCTGEVGWLDERGMISIVMSVC